uniref:Uncharacterized protein n=1 Tax=Odontella aurita TaxID=265563 RepID=A0A7S4HHE7_9STRA|mmetsp:Transcript_10056/g.29740  ORF Transcript_10056/g.29740 Transcript_10056/m.29740 type:complete len:238 (+) Transcript_10056:125-838(+)|eukprot:CAMPEP_0113526742 /NCGR_PEP_ID=MMETSP0015_2-20120614/913_1 /TAXON_ID=2838 /ORGANISM="Odontella" /LENGTH=237 /DNA_ID=CAMNT_0000425107 /DNA_START=28 /DNA_END=741 /DNA_ORIENTATION=- /assembly_acc=CAM_ASM_000160
MGKKGGKVRVKQVGPKGGMTGNPLADLAISPEEMINLPPKPDANISHVWPMSETFTMDYKQFHAIYPTYMDATKTSKQGRRIAAADSVPDPSVYEIGEVLQLMNIRHVVQPYKGYPRDPESRWDNPGRVLVDLGAAAESGVVTLGSDGAFDVDDVPDVDGDGEGNGARGTNKKVLCRELAKRVPSLPSRVKRLEEKKKAEEEERQAREKEAAAAKKASGGGGGSSSGHKKKKGKKRR